MSEPGLAELKKKQQSNNEFAWMSLFSDGEVPVAPLAEMTVLIFHGHLFVFGEINLAMQLN